MPPAKRRKISPKVEEVTFDHSARHDFLTGFHKRKLQRTRRAQEAAEKRAREEARLQRKKIREQRTAEFQRAIDEHRKQLEKISGDGDNNSSDSDSEPNDGEGKWEGFEELPAVDYEAEYIDEDKYTTVTVEEMDASREGLLKFHKSESSDEEQQQSTNKEAKYMSDMPTEKIKATKRSDTSRKKKTRFRYESKEDRKLNQFKQRHSNVKKAVSRRREG